MNLTELYLDAAKFEATVNHYRRLTKIAERISKRLRNRIVIASRITHEQENMSKPISERHGFENINLNHYKEQMQMNEGMIEVLQSALEVSGRTYPQHQQ